MGSRSWQSGGAQGLTIAAPSGVHLMAWLDASLSARKLCAAKNARPEDQLEHAASSEQCDSAVAPTGAIAQDCSCKDGESDGMALHMQGLQPIGDETKLGAPQQRQALSPWEKCHPSGGGSQVRGSAHADPSKTPPRRGSWTPRIASGHALHRRQACTPSMGLASDDCATATEANPSRLTHALLEP